MFITSSLNVFLIQLLRAREAAIWELEERQIHEKQQLAKRQLKDIFFLQRHQVRLKTAWSEVELYKRVSFRMLKFLAPMTGVGCLFIYSSVRQWFVWQFKSSGMWCDVIVEVVSDVLEEWLLHLQGLNWTAADRSDCPTMILNHSTSQVTLLLMWQSEHLCFEGKQICLCILWKIQNEKGLCVWNGIWFVCKASFGRYLISRLLTLYWTKQNTQVKAWICMVILC